MSVTKTLKRILMGTVFALPMFAGAKGADLVLYSPQPIAEQDTDLLLPAVSGINGKLEISGGLLRVPPTNYAHARINGSLSLPVTDRFGVQGDLGVYNTPTGVGVSGAVHAFTRDPSQYLLGVTGAFVRVPGATLLGIGPEAELYMGDWTLEAWAGIGHLNYDDALLTDVTGIYAIADLAYYITPDFRLSVGGSHVLGYNQLRLGTEYQVTSWEFPFSVTGEARFGQDGAIVATVGLKHYFGDADKSLIDRHRQDDPPDRALDFFGAAGSQLYKTATAASPAAPVPSDFNNESGCENAGFDWIFDSEGDYCDYPAG